MTDIAPLCSSMHCTTHYFHPMDSPTEQKAPKDCACALTASQQTTGLVVALQLQCRNPLQNPLVLQLLLWHAVAHPTPSHSPQPTAVTAQDSTNHPIDSSATPYTAAIGHQSHNWHEYPYTALPTRRPLTLLERGGLYVDHTQTLCCALHFTQNLCPALSAHPEPLAYPVSPPKTPVLPCQPTQNPCPTLSAHR
jgi:hypothetical protein